MSASPLFLLTRVDSLDDALAKDAARVGFRVTRLQLLATEPGADLSKLSRRLAKLEQGTAIAWTSRRAGQALSSVALPQWRETLSCVLLYSVGDESAAPVRQAGLNVLTPAAKAGAGELARLIAKRASADGVRRVIFLHGDRSLPDLPKGLRAAGIEVEPFEIYRMRFLSPDVSILEAALRDDTRVAAAFFSPSGVDALERLLSDETTTRLHDRVAAFARGETTFEALTSRGYRNTLRYAGAAALESWARSAVQTIVKGRP